MSRINTNVNSLIAQRVLNTNNRGLNTSLERLSTGLRINRGSDNPAGLIASESLRAEKAGIGKAIDNAERASNLIGTAEGGLGEISSLLTELQGLTTEAANSGALSADEISANQLQVDSILGTINRLANSTEFQGRKLLNGNLGYTTSGVSSSSVANLRINSARLPDGAAQAISITVTQSAQIASVNGGTAAVGTGGVTLELTGLDGAEQLSFGSGATLSSIQTAVNAIRETTGVSATFSGANLVFGSTTFGEDSFVTVRALSGSFNSFTSGGTTDNGRDAIVNVNGAVADTNGRTVSVRTGGLDATFDLTDASNSDTFTVSIGVTGGGATFNLGGRVNEGTKRSIGINGVTTGNLGNGTDGFLSSLASGGTNALNANNTNTTQKIISESINQVSQLRGRLGAFQRYDIGSTVNSLGVAFENISAAESAIRDTDFAAETANLTRSQILSQAASSVLSQANSAPQAALSLLR